MPAKITTVQAKAQFAETINRVAYGGERVVITRRGRDLVAIIPMDDFARLLASPKPTPPTPAPQEMPEIGDDEGLDLSLL